MKAIVAVDKFWGIGKNNGLLFQLKKDMFFFRNETLGKVIVMGSNTLKSFPGGNPLKGRTNIVLYPNGEKRQDCVIVNNLDELFREINKYPTDEVYIVGGAMFYKTMLPYCGEVLVTKVDCDGQAQVFFENLDELPNWTCIKESEPVDDNGYTVRFTVYKNNVIADRGVNK